MMAKDNRPAIFVFTTAYGPFVGGAEIAVQEVTRRLAREFRFFIITWRPRRDLPAREEREEGTIIRVSFGTELGKLALPFLGTLRALSLMRETTPVLFWPVMVTFASGIPYLVNLIRFWDPIPIILTLQEGDPEAHIRRSRFGLIGLAWRVALACTDYVTTISAYLERLARRFGYRGGAVVIPNGVALERYHTAKRSGSLPPTVITVSRLVKKNGVDTLIRAIAILRSKRADVRLLIVGDGMERSNLESLTRGLGLEAAVEFIGDVPPEDVPQYLARAHIFARPSRSEGLGSAFIEALASGLPIIGTPVGGIPDIIEDSKTGLFCRVDDPSDLAEKIERLLADQALSGRIAGQGQAMVRERFSWDVVTRAYRNVFRRCGAGVSRVLIATPQFPPDIGGPGSYAKNLAEALADHGVAVSILTYGSRRHPPPTVRDLKAVPHRIPSGLKHLRYFWLAFWMLRRVDAALVFDPVIVGVPVVLAVALLRKPLALRVEGDFLWERHVERTRRDLTLRQFYAQFPDVRRQLNLKERLMHRLARFAYHRARVVVFSSRWRRDIFLHGYASRSPLAIIASPWPAADQGQDQREPVFLYAGRFIHVKNLGRLIRAFAASAPAEYRLELIGEGPERENLEFIIHNLELQGRVVIRPPMAPDELRKRIASAHALLLPSLSEVSPNVILDCIAAGTSFLLTRETGFYETLKDIGLFVDPMDENDIAAKLRMLLDPIAYARYRERLGAFNQARSWGQVADEWQGLIQTIT